MLANVLAIVAGVPLGVLLISLIVRGEEIVGMLLHVLQYLFEAITYILAALAFAATTLQLFLVRDRSKRAKQLRQRYQHEAQVRQLEATLKTWQPFTIDKNAAMRNTMLSEMHQNARTLVVPQHWDTTDIKPPTVLMLDEQSTYTAAEFERLLAQIREIQMPSSVRNNIERYASEIHPPKGSESVYSIRGRTRKGTSYRRQDSKEWPQ